MQLNINSIDYRGSIVDGPGVRTILYVQGCEQRCEGCHNPSTWDKDKGKIVDVEEIADQLNKNCINKKITISGGEPLLQREAVVELVRLLPDFNIVLYTGLSIEAVPRELLAKVDYLKVGRFHIEERTTVDPYIGSRNQRFIDLRRNYQ
jgi:anaerobic ribonucleoside-triphosphate reductase activating protein